jgi:sulfur relay (sulfurtransferase) DsrF/TusC family protein
MLGCSSSLLSTLEQIEVNTTEQGYIDKAIYQLKNEKQSEKVVVKNLVRDLRLIIIHNS